MAKTETTSEAVALLASRSITIQDVIFTIGDVYTEGHVCTAKEAQALNQTRAENIRNNFAKTVKDAKPEDGALTDEQKAALQSDLDKYAAEYEFSVGGGRTLDPIDKEAKLIAANIIDGAIAKSGMSRAKYIETKGKDYYDGLIAQMMAKPNVRDEATEIVKRREAIADSVQI